MPAALAVACDEGGTYDHKAIGGDSGPANAHTRATGHATVCHVAEWEDAA